MEGKHQTNCTQAIGPFDFDDASSIVQVFILYDWHGSHLFFFQLDGYIYTTMLSHTAIKLKSRGEIRKFELKGSNVKYITYDNQNLNPNM